MARPKKPPEPPPAAERTTVVNLKGSQAYRDWLSGLSRKTMIPVASIVRAALAAWARENRHQAPPEA